jgi:hypothetical protein
MGQFTKLCRTNSPAILKANLFLAFVVCLFISGCKGGSETTWSAESRSPDGKMIATARTIVSSGFGAGGYSSSVSLNWTTGSQRPVDILVFMDAPAEPGNTSVVGMKWLTPTHLALTFMGNRTIWFQAVKCEGVDISVIGLPDKTHVISEVRSPDMLWLAYVQLEEKGVPGNALFHTSVYLRWINGIIGSEPIEILRFSPETEATSSNTHISVNWTDTTHLEVTNNGHAKVETKLAKYSDINISLRDLSIDPIKPAR